LHFGFALWRRACLDRTLSFSTLAQSACDWIKNIQAGATPQNTLTKKIGEVGEHSGDGLPLPF
tara:strand:- start:2422 stop:2610 length:189 start_codon:yes stop_codon:yes gene_type:complete